jgi:hypothetical protein
LGAFIQPVRPGRDGSGGNAAANALSTFGQYLRTRGGDADREAQTALGAVIADTLSSLKDPRGIKWFSPYSCAEAVRKNDNEAVAESGVAEQFEASLRAQFGSYKELCQDLLNDAHKVDELLAMLPKQSLLKEAAVAFEAALSEFEALTDAIKVVKGKLPKKKKDSDSEDDFLAKLQKSAGDVAGALDSAANSGKALGIDKALTEERVEALSVILRAFGGGSVSDLSAEDQKALKARPALHRAAIIAAGREMSKNCGHCGRSPEAAPGWLSNTAT